MKRGHWFYVVVACALLSLACGPKASVRIPEQPGRVDAPYELQSDEDLADSRTLYDALALHDPKRAAKRSALAAEYARRTDQLLRNEEAPRAFLRFTELLTLWTPTELKRKTGDLGAFLPQAKAIRARFARSGGANETVAALAALTIMDAASAKRHRAEIDEILSYNDELAVALHGPNASRAYPIRILESTAEIFPLPFVVDGLLRLYQERQAAISSAIRRGNANIDIGLVQLHGEGLLTTTRNIVRLLAQNGEFAAWLPSIRQISGLGDNADLRKRVAAAMASTDAAPWLALSAGFRANPEDRKAALAICVEAIRRYPKEALPYLSAAGTAKEMGNAPLAIRFYEAGLAIDGEYLAASQDLANLYEARVNALAHGDRPNAALQQLRTFEQFHSKASKLFEKPLEPDLASAYAVMGRGLVSLGDLVAARDYLARSLALRLNLPSLEYLGLIALRQEKFAEARTHFVRALSIEGKGFGAQFDSHRLQRLGAEALLGSGKKSQAFKEFKTTQSAWREILEQYEVPEEPKAEVLIELGKLELQLGQADEAVGHFFEALAASPDNGSNHADLVAFLVNHEAFDAARDVFLDALGNTNISQYFKIYMSLWIQAEARSTGRPPDPHAAEFLEQRSSTQWSAELARYAAGKGDRKRLESMATTRGRRAEFMYYSAVLGPESKNPEQARMLLEEVLRGEMVLFFEYEMAARRLRGL
jgi:tetratricopeptide (TPR) repeat protein